MRNDSLDVHMSMNALEGGEATLPISLNGRAALIEPVSSEKILSQTFPNHCPPSSAPNRLERGWFTLQPWCL